MAKADTKKAEVKQPGTAVAESVNAPLVLVQDQVPEHLRDAMTQNRGSENVGQDDLVIPRLEVLQALSPELDESHSEYIKGAKQGDLINSVTRQIYGREVFVVPVHYTKQWLVWIERNSGGGFRGGFPDPDSAEKRAEEVRKEPNTPKVDVIDTPTHFCLLVNRDTGGVEEIVVAMPRTKAKVSRAWNSMVKLAGGDRFARVYRIASQQEKNAKGTFQNFAIAQSGFPAKPLYDRAVKVYEEIKAGTKTRTMDVQGFNAGEAAQEEHAEM